MVMKIMHLLRIAAPLCALLKCCSRVPKSRGSGPSVSGAAGWREDEDLAAVGAYCLKRMEVRHCVDGN